VTDKIYAAKSGRNGDTRELQTKKELASHHPCPKHTLHISYAYLQIEPFIQHTGLASWTTQSIKQRDMIHTRYCDCTDRCLSMRCEVEEATTCGRSWDLGTDLTNHPLNLANLPRHSIWDLCTRFLSQSSYSFCECIRLLLPTIIRYADAAIEPT
jgi:hypothetical protein